MSRSRGAPLAPALNQCRGGPAWIFYQTFDLGSHYAEAHNDYLQLAAEGGLLLGIPIVVTLVLFVRGV